MGIAGVMADTTMEETKMIMDNWIDTELGSRICLPISLLYSVKLLMQFQFTVSVIIVSAAVMVPGWSGRM